MIYKATVSFADATNGYAPGSDYELDEADAAEFVKLGWLVADAPPAKRTRKPKAEQATAPAAIETAALDA